MKSALLICCILFTSADAGAAPEDSQIDALSDHIEEKVIAWRRDIHQHPELGFQETRTAALVAEHLQTLEFDEVITGLGGTGVVGILKGGEPGPVVALRADMDALPIKDSTGLPFASTATADWQGSQVPVMHACGHDAHAATLLGAADVLASLRQTLPGNVMFVFQPAEEGSESGGGAEAMLNDGLFDIRKPAAIFGLHVGPYESGSLYVRAGPTGGLGAMPPGVIVYNHSANFTIDEGALETGVTTLNTLAINFLTQEVIG